MLHAPTVLCFCALVLFTAGGHAEDCRGKADCWECCQASSNVEACRFQCDIYDDTSSCMQEATLPECQECCESTKWFMDYSKSLCDEFCTFMR